MGNTAPTAYTGSVASEYDRRRFATPQGLFVHALECRHLLRHIEDAGVESQALEVGCGTGRFTALMANRCAEVTAVDPSPDMLLLARKKCAGRSNVKFVQAEGARLPFGDASFDIVYSVRVLNQVESKEYALSMISEMARVLRPGGKMCVEFCNQSRPLAKKTKAIRLSFSEIEQAGTALRLETVKRSGAFLFSMTVAQAMPAFLLSAGGALESMAHPLFWRLASRGYISLRKRV